jgi:hypothetical protein
MSDPLFGERQSQMPDLETTPLVVMVLLDRIGHAAQMAQVVGAAGQITGGYIPRHTLCGRGIALGVETIPNEVEMRVYLDSDAICHDCVHLINAMPITPGIAFAGNFDRQVRRRAPFEGKA